MYKILHYSPRFYPLLGGVETHVDTIVKNLPDYQFEVIARGIKNEPTYEKYNENTSVKRFYPFDYWTSPPRINVPWKIKLLHNSWADFLRTTRINRYIDSSEFDLLHIHEIDVWDLLRLDILLRTNTFARLAERLSDYSNEKKPVLLTKHYLHNTANTPKKFKNFENKFIDKIPNIICVDKHIYEYINEKWDNKNIWFIPNSIDTKKFNLTPLPDETKLNIGFIGRFDAIKGIEMLNKFLVKLPLYVKVNLVLSGNEAEISSFYRLLNIDRSNIDIHINLPNHLIPIVLKNIDVLFNPILIPGISRTTIEAMACGRPVIMYKYGDRYPLIHGKNGFVINEDLEELLSLLDYLNENRYIIKIMGKAARNIIESEFNNEKKITELRKIYRQLMT